MITTHALIALFRQTLSEKWGYIWGTAGVLWTAAKQKELEKTTDDNRKQGRLYGKKWIGHKVADCSGLFAWAFKQLGGTMYHGSNTMYLKWCADKGRLEKGKRTDGKTLKPGMAVFVWNGRTYSHVGLYAGDDTVIEAMGTRMGVTTSKVSATKWTHWGELNGVDYGNKETGNNGEGNKGTGNKGTVTAVPRTWNKVTDSTFLQPSSATGGGWRNARSVPTSTVPEAPRQTLRRGSKGDSVREAQTLLSQLGFSLGPCGVDGDFGKCTEAAVRQFQTSRGLAADGIVGKQTWAELRKE